MEKTTSTFILLLALTAIGAGCGSAKEFQVDVSDAVPMEAPSDQVLAPEAAAPEEVAPAPQADAGDTSDEAVLPENPQDAAADSPMFIAKLGDRREYYKEVKRVVTIPQQVIADSGDRREEVKAVIGLTPEQKQALFDKGAEKLFANKPVLQNAECLQKGLGREDCDD